MKRTALLLAAFMAFSLTSCNNAADKVKSDDNKKSEQKDEGSMNNAGNNQRGNNMQNNNQNQMSGNDVSSEGKGEFSFKKESHNFGQITEGTVAKHNFTFTNTGEAPLIISNASGSCGCTVPEWPREPIAPGEEGTIHVEFNSTNRTGNQQKQVTLTANTVPNKKILRISAQVQPKKGGQEAQGDSK